MVARLIGWLRDRYPVEPVRAFLHAQATKRLPGHVSWAHTFGSLTLFLLVNQIVTGILLMVYYRPTPDHAFESVGYVMHEVPAGWLIRGLHAWGATLMILAMVAHMFRTFWMGAFKRPRELTWVLGALLLFAVLTFSFTGYLLPWNQTAYWATIVGTEIAGTVPGVGAAFRDLLRGGEGVGGETLGRFYVVHVAVLPWIVTALAIAHLVLMRVQGLASLDERPGAPFFPHHVLREGIALAFLLMVMFGLVAVLPPELGDKADPLATPPGIKPEWYFLPTYQLLKYFPKTAGVLVSFLPLLLVLVWPFLDRSTERRPSRRRVSIAIGVGALLLAIVFGLLGHFAERDVRVFGRTYHVDLYGIPKDR